MTILFFDVDGPAVPARALFLPDNLLPKYGWQFDPVMCHFINFLGWAVPDLQIVIASHRRGMLSPFDGSWTSDHNSWARIMQENQINVPLHKDWCTAKDKSEVHAKIVEISQWLARHPEVKTFVTIEDEAAGYDQEANDAQRKYLNLCGEDYLNGITWQDMERICEFFKLGKLDIMLDKYRQHLFDSKQPKNRRETLARDRRINRVVAHRDGIPA